MEERVEVKIVEHVVRPKRVRIEAEVESTLRTSSDVKGSRNLGMPLTIALLSMPNDGFCMGSGCGTGTAAGAGGAAAADPFAAAAAALGPLPKLAALPGVAGVGTSVSAGASAAGAAPALALAAAGFFCVAACK